MRYLLPLLFLIHPNLQKIQAQPDPKKTVDSLIQATRTLLNQTKFEQAMQAIAQAEQLAAQNFGKNSATYANCAHNFGRAMFMKGDYAGCEKWCSEALQIREKVLGKDHPEYAHTLVNLGNAQIIQSNYERAEPLYLEAMHVYEKALGTENPFFSGAVQNLASVYFFIGNHEKAEAFYLRSLAIFEKSMGKENSSYLNCLNSLGLLSTTTGKFDRAEQYYLETLATKEKLHGRSHAEYATAVHNLAHLYEQKGDFEKSDSMYRASLAIVAATLGKEHFDYSTNLYNYANLCMSLERFEEAEKMYSEAREIRQKTVGKNHAFVNTLVGLATLNKIRGKFERAKTDFEEIAAVNQNIIAKSLHHLSESELHKYLQTFTAAQNQVLSFQTAANGSGQGIETTCFDNALFYKGFLQNTAIQSKKRTLANPATAELAQELNFQGRKLSNFYSQPLALRNADLVASTETKINDLEKELVRQLAGYAEATRMVRWQEVQAKLRPDEAAVEFVHFDFYDKKLTSEIRYAALVLRPGTTAPQFVPLFEKRQIEEQLKKMRGSNFLKINELYENTGADGLAALVWHPIVPLLAGVKKVFCSPSGLLHQINLGAIKISEKETFADRHALITMGSTRQLVVDFHPEKSAQNNAYLAGGIRYSTDGAATEPAKNAIATRSRGLFEAEELFFTADTTLRGNTWDYLPETQREVLEINNLLKKSGLETRLDTGFAATEEAFRILGTEAPSPKIIHLSTHGFFFPENKKTAGKSGEPIFKISEHPMIRTGLILAGGNQVWQGNRPLDGREDGILTAHEISQMNLSQTELVVLSACETALGDIAGNEGVYGLQRAFKIAGAKYLIMSLWKVNDQTTRELMTEFYKKWLVERLEIPDAFHAAQAAMRAKYPDAPFHWAGFVLVE